MHVTLKKLEETSVLLNQMPSSDAKALHAQKQASQKGKVNRQQISGSDSETELLWQHKQQRC